MNSKTANFSQHDFKLATFKIQMVELTLFFIWNSYNAIDVYFTRHEYIERQTVFALRWWMRHYKSGLDAYIAVLKCI